LPQEIDTLYLPREAAERLRVSEWTVRSWLRTKRLAKTRVGGKVMVTESSVKKFLEDSAARPVREAPAAFAVHRNSRKPRKPTFAVNKRKRKQ
jgi:excisionase family DNA binding protein